MNAFPHDMNAHYCPRQQMEISRTAVRAKHHRGSGKLFLWLGRRGQLLRRQGGSVRAFEGVAHDAAHDKGRRPSRVLRREGTTVGGLHSLAFWRFFFHFLFFSFSCFLTPHVLV